MIDRLNRDKLLMLTKKLASDHHPLKTLKVVHERFLLEKYLQEFVPLQADIKEQQ